MMHILKHLTFLIIFIYSFQVQAAAVLDQEYIPQSISGSNITGGGYTAQTFTADITGTLDSVSAQIINWGNSSADVTLSLYTTLSGVPSSSLGSVTLGSSTFATNYSGIGTAYFTTFDFAPFNIDILAGSIYALVVTTSVTAFENTIAWRADAENGIDHYLSGQRYTSGDGVNWAPNSDWDYGFQTYVTATTSDSSSQVPVPAPLALVGLGLIALGLTRKQKA